MATRSAACPRNFDDWRDRQRHFQLGIEKVRSAGEKTQNPPYSAELEAITDEGERGKRLVELNVQEGVYNLCKTSTIQNAWKQRQELSVHGWAYSLESGIIQDLDVTFDSAEKLVDVFKFENK